MKEKRLNVKRQNAKQSIITSAFALLFSLILGAVLLAVCGYSPIESYDAIFGASLGNCQGLSPIIEPSDAHPVHWSFLCHR